MKKKRLDEILIEKGFSPNLERATSLILSGSVIVNGKKVYKAGNLFSLDSKIEIIEKIPEFVSRAAYKLKSALEVFKINLNEKICLDLGASTGGFTEILLLNGAKKVYSFDVGYGQMSARLQNHPKVILKDRFNVRDLTWSEIDETEILELFIVIDLSFISLLKIFPVILSLKKQKPNCKIYCLSLIKPQFECSPNETSKGIVIDPKVHYKVLTKIWRFLRKEIQADCIGICNSGIKGSSGNKEFFIYWKLD